MAETAEAQVRSMIDAWARAIRAKDVTGLVAHQAPDFVQFDFAPPLRIVGPHPQAMADWFATWRGPIGFEITDLHVAASK